MRHRYIPVAACLVAFSVASETVGPHHPHSLAPAWETVLAPPPVGMPTSEHVLHEDHIPELLRPTSVLASGVSSITVRPGTGGLRLSGEAPTVFIEAIRRS